MMQGETLPPEMATDWVETLLAECAGRDVGDVAWGGGLVMLYLYFCSHSLQDKSPKKFCKYDLLLNKHVDNLYMCFT